MLLERTANTQPCWYSYPLLGVFGPCMGCLCVVSRLARARWWSSAPPCFWIRPPFLYCASHPACPPPPFIRGLDPRFLGLRVCYTAARAAASCSWTIQLAASMDVTSMDATRCSESSRDREERLRRRRKRERARRATDTAEQRAHRLWQRRERDRARRALQSSERRERELQRMRATSHDRLTAETGEEREARLDRLASETGEEREERLQQMRDRLASETRTPMMPTFQLLSSPAPLSGWLSRRLSGSLCKNDSLISNKWLPLQCHGWYCWLCCSTTACCHCHCRELLQTPSDIRRW